MGNSTDSRFVAGHYTASFTGGEENTAGSLDIGTTEVGFNLRVSHYREDIRIDDFGDTVVDGIYRGMNGHLSFELVRWVADIQAILQPHYADAGNTVYGSLGVNVGKNWAYLGGSLVLTPVANINSNLTIFTFPMIVPDGEHGGFTMNTRLRRMACNFILLPGDLTDSEYALWTETAVT